MAAKQGLVAGKGARSGSALRGRALGLFRKKEGAKLFGAGAGAATKARNARKGFIQQLKTMKKGSRRYGQTVRKIRYAEAISGQGGSRRYRIKK